MFCALSDKKGMDIKMIPIVFGIDKSYILQVFTVMHSVLKNTKSEIHFIMLSKDEIEEYTDKFVEILRKTYGNFTLDIRGVQEEVFDNVQIYHKHLSMSSYFRLLIPELVKEYDKCIYLDSDILVNGDILELFNVDIDDYYLAGVPDCNLIFGRNFYVSMNEHIKANMPSAKKYVNAGVLVMNLKKLRDDNMITEFLLQAKRENPYEDQDVINFCCYEAIKTLPIKYNMFQHYTGNAVKYLLNAESMSSEIGINGSAPTILHCNSRYKPWENRKYKSSDRWWELAELFKNTQYYYSVFQDCRKVGDDLREMNHIFEICSGKKVILWGFTDQGKDVCDIFLRRGITPYAFCDNDKKKQGESYKGISVLKLDSERDKEGIIWVVTCKNAYQEVQKQLLDAGIEGADIFHFTFNNRDKEEYFVIDSRYYEEEVQIITLCENDKAKMGDEEFLACLHRLIEKADMKDEMYGYLYRKYRFDLWLKA